MRHITPRPARRRGPAPLAALPTLVALVALVASCQPAPRDTREAREAREPAFAGTTERTERVGAPTGVATLAAVRTGAGHVGYERVVFEFDGEGLPGYVIEYAAAPPAMCGSGEPVAVAGAASLVVRFDPARAHREGADGRVASTVTPHDRRVAGPGAIRQLTRTCDFEAVVEWVIGLDRRRAYRALALGAPPRLVVDVGTDAGGVAR